MANTNVGISTAQIRQAELKQSEHAHGGGAAERGRQRMEELSGGQPAAAKKRASRKKPSK